MKLLSTLLISAIALTSINAKTTMCFKENHKSMSTIENTKLDGGLCKSTNSANDMVNNGWNIDDIKINKSTNGFNYIYIFKKGSSTTFSSNNISDKDLEEKIVARIKKEEKIKKEIAIKKKRTAQVESGKIKYTNVCQTCHGTNGEVPYGTSREINKLSLDEFKTTMRDYGNMAYDRGQAMVMYPYTSTVTAEDVENIYEYLQKINK